MSDLPHETVLRDETVGGIRPRDGGVYLDLTLGAGGHTEALLAASAPTGTVIAFDRDPVAHEIARARLGPSVERVTFVTSSFGDVRSALRGVRVDGALADLGVSSMQIDEPERGLSFRAEGPLDMRMGTDVEVTAWQLVRDLRDTELADVIYEYGEERASRPIARSIKRAIEDGRMETTRDLAAAVHRVLGPARPGRIDPATRTFQALRIAVNDELNQLKTLLRDLPDVLVPGGYAAIISFHSLEDRIVKWAFRDDARWEVITRKPVEASDAECQRNPRARSAKLRVARTTEDAP